MDGNRWMDGKRGWWNGLVDFVGRVNVKNTLACFLHYMLVLFFFFIIIAGVILVCGGRLTSFSVCNDFLP